MNEFESKERFEDLKKGFELGVESRKNYAFSPHFVPDFVKLFCIKCEDKFSGIYYTKEYQRYCKFCAVKEALKLGIRLVF